MQRVDYSGRRYGRLLVVSMIYEAGKDAKAKCICDCGIEKTVTAYNLQSGNTTSCGCLSHEKRVERGKEWGARSGSFNRTHGYSNTPTYASWSDAKKRCYSPQNKRFAEYGGRGIGMCDTWKNSFDAFLRDMGERPNGTSLERKNVNKGYEPGNCVWATPAQQAQNKRTNVANWEIVRALRNGRACGKTCVQLAREFDMSYGNVRLICSGKTWSDDGYAK